MFLVTIDKKFNTLIGKHDTLIGFKKNAKRKKKLKKMTKKCWVIF